MVISLFGVVLIIFGSSKKISFGSEVLFGDILMFFAAMMWALNTNLQKFFLTRYSASQLTFIWMMVGSASLTLIALPSAQTVDFTALHWSYYLAAFSDVLLIYRGLNNEEIDSPAQIFPVNVGGIPLHDAV